MIIDVKVPTNIGRADLLAAIERLGFDPEQVRTLSLQRDMVTAELFTRTTPWVSLNAEVRVR